MLSAAHSLFVPSLNGPFLPQAAPLTRLISISPPVDLVAKALFVAHGSALRSGAGHTGWAEDRAGFVTRYGQLTDDEPTRVA